MGKKTKSKGSRNSLSKGRARAIAAGAITLAPALIAAATAFMNTTVAKDNGLSFGQLSDRATGKGKGKGKRKGSKKSRSQSWLTQGGDSSDA